MCTVIDAEEGETAGEEKDKAKDSDEEEDDDDNINVVIGDLRTTPGYGPGLHIKRGNLLTLTKVCYLIVIIYLNYFLTKT